MKLKTLKLIALAMLITALVATVAQARGSRDEFPEVRCPGSSCPTRR